MTDMNLDNARGWRPEVGDVLLGEVLSVDKGWSDQAEKFYPIITIRPEGQARVGVIDKGEVTDKREFTDEPVAVHCFHTVLYMRVAELRPRIGERIGIKFVKGTEKTKDKKKNTPSIYNVRIQGRSADIWDVMEADPRTTIARAQNSLPVASGDFNVSEVVTGSDDDIPF